MKCHHNEHRRSPLVTIAIGLCIAILVFFLWTEHRAHLYGVLPYLLLLACPLMHLFMHRDHHTHHSSAEKEGQPR